VFPFKRSSIGIIEKAYEEYLKKDRTRKKLKRLENKMKPNQSQNKMHID